MSHIEEAVRLLMYDAEGGGNVEGLEASESTDPSRKKNSSSWPRVLAFVMLLLVFVAVIFTGTIQIPRSSRTTVSLLASSCRAPVTRREWRSLDDEEKHSYLKAVQCLHTIPSNISPEQSVYDAFAYTHVRFGNSTHGTAGFLPWHRYFIAIYEEKLRNHCQYTGSLPYWDWTLDWNNFRQSPIWDTDTGFGGDGGINATQSVGTGRCVVDGPFAEFRVLNNGMRLQSHCLARGFPSERELSRWTGTFKPEALEQVMSAQQYEDFLLKLEEGPHLGIPYSIRGDFYKFTAANDPVFFLHHTQVDRLWWKWQHENSQHKVHWGGLAWDGSGRNADVDDILDFGSLASGVPAGDLLSTRTDVLCYRY